MRKTCAVLFLIIFLQFAFAASESLDTSAGSVSKLNRLFASSPVFKDARVESFGGWNVTFGPPLLRPPGSARFGETIFPDNMSRILVFLISPPTLIRLVPPNSRAGIKSVDWILVRPKTNANNIQIEVTATLPFGQLWRRGSMFDCYTENVEYCWVIAQKQARFSFKLVSAGGKKRVGFREPVLICPNKESLESQCLELAVAKDGTLLPKVNGRTFVSLIAALGALDALDQLAKASPTPGPGPTPEIDIA